MWTFESIDFEGKHNGLSDRVRSTHVSNGTSILTPQVTSHWQPNWPSYLQPHISKSPTHIIVISKMLLSNQTRQGISLFGTFPFSNFICISPWYWWWGENMGRFEESESLLSSNFIEGAAAALLLCYCGSWYFHTCCCTARARRVHRSLTSCHFHTCLLSHLHIFTLA